MIRFAPIMPRSDSIAILGCPKCGAGMRLFGIEADGLNCELLSFECPQCENVETKMRKSNMPNFT